MRKRVVIIIFLSCCVVSALFYIAFSYPWVIYPTKSSPHKLSFVVHSGAWENKPKITLKHYVNGLHVRDYILNIKTGVHIQEPQSYELPDLDKGMVEVNINLGDEMNSNFTLTYDNGEDLYQRGLLIYLADFDDNHNLLAYLVSGKETTCYNRTPGSTKWAIKEDVPSPKFFPHKEYYAYISIYCGWKDNKWVVKDINNGTKR